MKIVDNRKISNHQALAKEIYRILYACYGKSPWSEQMIVSDLTRAEVRYYLAYQGNHLKAFLATQTVLDELEITNLAVLPENQRQGLASRLLQALSGFPGTLFLEVRESNLTARRLYEEFGFIEFNRRKSYYVDPVEDALLLKKLQLNHVKERTEKQN